MLGNYTVIVSIIDNNEYYRNNETGLFDPFIEEETFSQKYVYFILIETNSIQVICGMLEEIECAELRKAYGNERMF